MKSRTAKLLVFALCLGIPVMAGAIAIDLYGGPTGSTLVGQARGGNERQLITSTIAGDYYEAARNGQIYTIKTASAGTSISGAGASPLGAAGVAFLAVYNPAGTGVNLEITEVKLAGISGTPGAGGIWYNLGCGQNITAAPNATPVNTLNLSAGAAKGFLNTALTGSTALTEVGMAPYAPFAVAFASSALPPPPVVDYTNGRFVVGQGCVFAIQPGVVGTSHVVVGELSWRQAVP